MSGAGGGGDHIYVYIYVGMYMCKDAPKYISIHLNMATYIHIRINISMNACGSVCLEASGWRAAGWAL